MQVIVNLLKGVAIGLANVIPGVSGGTMALMLGIYERLIRAVRNIGLSTLLAPFRGRAVLRGQLRRVDAGFLLCIGVGAAIAAVGAAKLLLYLLAQQHDPTYGFFFGLVLLSLVVPYRMIKKVSPGVIVALIVAVVAVVGLTLGMSGERRLESARSKAEIRAAASAAQVGGSSSGAMQTDASTAAFFLVAGAVAISAMVLPGISGSFMLLLMGIYFDVLLCVSRTVSLAKQILKQLLALAGIGGGELAAAPPLGELLGELGVQLVPLAILAVGCVLGLLLFTRLINYMLERYHDLTMGFLLGLVLGSLYAIWPFKSYEMVAGQRIDLHNVLPPGLGANEALTFGTTVLGCAVVGAFLWLEGRKQAVEAK